MRFFFPGFTWEEKPHKEVDITRFALKGLGWDQSPGQASHPG
jgi:hypothetical protein